MKIELRKEQLPWGMVALRAALGPIVIAGQACRWSGIALAALIVAALVSDIFDGVLARRWHCDTHALRLSDSMADTAFYLCTAIALGIAKPQIWRMHVALLGPLVALEAARFVIDLAKFRRPASYHSYLAKTWGLLLAVAVIASFASKHGSPLISAALLIGIVCDLEGLAMSLILPAWHRDVKTLRAAWQLRRDDLSFLAFHQAPKPIPAFVSKAAVFAFILCVVPSAFAVSPVGPGTIPATYDSGTASNLTAGTEGALELSSPDALIFHDTAHGKSLAIPYKTIVGFEYTHPVTHHLGILPTIAAALVSARQRQHIFTITYTDDANKTQIALFEVSGSEPRTLLPLLRARTDVCPKNNSLCGGSLNYNALQ